MKCISNCNLILKIILFWNYNLKKSFYLHFLIVKFSGKDDILYNYLHFVMIAHMKKYIYVYSLFLICLFIYSIYI